MAVCAAAEQARHAPNLAQRVLLGRQPFGAVAPLMQPLRSAPWCLRGRHPVHDSSGGARCGAALAQRLRPGAREAVGETARADAQDGRSGGQDGRAGGQDGRAGGQDGRAAAISELQQAKAQAGVAVERKKAINILAEARKEATQIVRGPDPRQSPPRPLP